MAYPSVTNTLSDATTMDAVKINENFTDLIAGVSDGTKDLNINKLALNGYAAVTGNIYTSALTDYSSSVSIVGFSSFSTKQVFYKKIGNLVYLWLHLVGVSNDNGLYITLPFESGVSVGTDYPILACFANFDGTETLGIIQAYSSTDIVIFPDLGGSDWPLTGTKAISGCFFYEAA
jgi:hypothetical protein